MNLSTTLENCFCRKHKTRCKNQKQGTPIRQNWDVYIDVTIKLIKDRYLVSVALVNGSQVQSNGITHKSNKKSDDKPTIETLFNSGMEIELTGAAFSPIELDFFADDYKYNSCQMAVGNNCSVEYHKESNSITTNHLPTFVQKRLLTNDELAVSFQSLIDAPAATLTDIHQKMLAEHRKWEHKSEEKKPTLSPVGIKNMQEEIDEFAREIRRFEFGIEVISNYPIIMKSFVNMNRTFLKTSKKYNTWRLFQIVFIVSLVPDIAACDEDVLLDSEKAKTTLNEVSLLYFPTGGGKTEAFLGVLIFNLFFDRYRGKECGVTSILRYPLRLLSVQQVQRLANVLAQAELIRRADAAIARTEEFSLGYFVGDANTPNKIEKKDVVKLGKDSLSEYIFPGIPAVLIYCQNSQGFNLGSLFNTFEAYFDKWMNKAYASAQKCIFDPICIERQKACMGCLFVNEVSCQHFNKDLDRALVIGHVDRETQRKTTGFWEE